ncbi:sugar transferase [Paenibacillus turpanensis]|uniref:sugar transferase n=1 Tax=Paenibacillus turpanensis TaxID=2689078 RepID=UPI001407601A|nr:sugar transferase [Paenibacillus turpanensis]
MLETTRESKKHNNRGSSDADDSLGLAEAAVGLSTAASLYRLIDPAAELQKPRGAYVQFVKPLLDFTFALLFSVLLLPAALLIALLIKLDSKGPIIFKQPRYGKNGTVFHIYKFRTMYSSVPTQGRSPVSGNDARITRLGKILRKTSLDEIPQLLNILRGEMSFIGPRPEQKRIVEEQYTDKEKVRFLVTPGITGLWQISPDRKAPIHENLQHDIQYIQHVSFLLDLKIFMNTFIVMIKSNTH